MTGSAKQNGRELLPELYYDERVQHNQSHNHCHPPKGRPDLILWGSLGLILASVAYRYFWGLGLNLPWIDQFAASVTDLLAKMAWGLIFAVVFVGVMEQVPRSKFNQIFGNSDGVSGLVRATIAGILLDLCSHGILLVGMKLYERGISLGQVVAFLVASPWNSFSMTLILWSLIGLKLTLIFIGLSAIIALISGLIFNYLVSSEVLPKNPNQYLKSHATEAEAWIVWPTDKNFSGGLLHILKGSLRESKMILRWIFFGIILTASVKGLMSPESFQAYFGPDFTGVLLTLVAATVLEVCSEGSAPLAAELVTTAQAPGNGFSFLMAGVSTDYTEILALKETTKSWKVAFFLPLVTLPQIILMGLVLNGWF